MSREQIQKVIDLIERHWTPATQTRLDAKREIGRILDAALALPEPHPVATMTVGKKFGIRHATLELSGGIGTTPVGTHSLYLRTALAADAVPERCGTNQCSCISCVKICEWTYDDDGFFQSACGDASYMPDLTVGHPQEFMKHCYGCGKPIKFKESDDE